MIARKLLRTTVTNPLSAAYLGLVAAVTVFTVISAFVEEANEFIALWVILVTSPTSTLILGALQIFGGGEKDAAGLVVYVVIALSALIQSTALGLIWKLVRSDRARGVRPVNS
ncbi:SCO4225 family membrane protein [Streptomyces sp. NPDC087440]|uniref:SCO4225 family membrane protein n=1 Tax=Streptomyces sp. NPDC087440 TaxID=3365790 RepID=UPI00380678B4